jgi:putative oxidoreductase
MYWGLQYFQTGMGKIGDISKVADYFTSLNIPYPIFNAYIVAYLETVGGALLFVGLFSRLISIPLTVNMLVAYLAADREAFKSFLSEPDKFYAAAPYTFLFASLLILIFGPGRLSLDGLVGYIIEKRTARKMDDPALVAAS